MPMNAFFFSSADGREEPSFSEENSTSSLATRCGKEDSFSFFFLKSISAEFSNMKTTKLLE